MTRVLINYINNIKINLARMKNCKNVPNFVNNNIPNEWKLTGDKKQIISKYLKNEEFSQYTYKISKKKKLV